MWDENWISLVVFEKMRVLSAGTFRHSEDTLNAVTVWRNTFPTCTTRLQFVKLAEHGELGRAFHLSLTFQHTNSLLGEGGGLF